MSKQSLTKRNIMLCSLLVGFTTIGSACAETVIILEKSQGIPRIAETIVLSLLLVVLIVFTLMCGKRFVQIRKKYDEALENKENETR